MGSERAVVQAEEIIVYVAGGHSSESTRGFLIALKDRESACHS